MNLSTAIPFNKPYVTGRETGYIKEAIASGRLSGNGMFTQRCQNFFETKYGFGKCLLTTSCTDALEMAALLLDIKPGDEVILPSYTFVSTANAFVLRGATIVFADSLAKHPNLDHHSIESLVSPRTKAIVVVHYAGVACDMDCILAVAHKYGLFIVEDAAHCIESYYLKTYIEKQWLGGIGHLAAFSFHETKNIISGEGGMLVINDPSLAKRSEILWEKGTNRSAFFRGETDKYTWVDVGSSFLPSEINAAFLWAQLEELEHIQTMRMKAWEWYYTELTEWSTHWGIELPTLPTYAINNAHMFYIICSNDTQRVRLTDALKSKNIQAVFHYLGLHTSPFARSHFNTQPLPNCERFAACLLRLPLYPEVPADQVVDALRLIRLH